MSRNVNTYLSCQYQSLQLPLTSKWWRQGKTYFRSYQNGRTEFMASCPQGNLARTSSLKKQKHQPSICKLQVSLQLNYVLSYFCSKGTEAFSGVTGNWIRPIVTDKNRPGQVARSLLVHPFLELCCYITFHSLRLLYWDL